MKKSNIKKDYFWNTIGVFAQNAISPLLLIVITRINGIYDSGLFSLAFSISIIFWTIGLWGGRTYQTSDIKNTFFQKDYLTTKILLSVIMVVSGLLFCAINGYDSSKTLLVIVLVIFKATEAVSDALYGIMQINSNLYKSGISLSLKAVLGILLFIVIDYITHNIILASGVILFANITVLILYDLPVVRKFEKITIISDSYIKDFKKSVRVMRKTFIVFVISFLTTFSINIPRFFIDKYDSSELGYFGIMMMPVTLLVLFMTFIIQPKIVELANRYDKKELSEFRFIVQKILKQTLIIGIISLFCMVAFGAWVLTVVFGVNFYDYQEGLIIITIGAIANSMISIFTNIFTVMRKFKVQLLNVIISTIILFFASIFIGSNFSLVYGMILFTIVNIIQSMILFFIYRCYTKESK